MAASVEPVPEEKARKVLERVDLLSRLREEVAPLPDLRERLERTAEPALDLPEWWIPGRHDTDLVLGAARYEYMYCRGHYQFIENRYIARCAIPVRFV